MSSLALGAIGAYRRYLSPLKGFRCAHNAVHHRGSCSDFALLVYRRQTFITATALMLRRLRACRRAYGIYVVRMSTATAEDEEAQRKKKSGICDALDVLNCATYPLPDAACFDLGVCDCLGAFSI